jgi:hypothetical protein
MVEMITLFVGDCGEYLCECAKKHDPDAFLIEFSNYKKILKKINQKESFTAYTSLADLPKITDCGSPIWELLSRSDNIYYMPPESWSDDDGSFSWGKQKILLEFYLYHCQLSGKQVTGLDLAEYKNSKYLDLVAIRNNDAQSLWVCGCSITHGKGINDDQKYGNIIGKTLSVPTYHLTALGSSLEWQADQILRSDIRKSDIVIWGLTHEKRAPLSKNGMTVPWPDDTIENVEYRLHETRFYKAITSVYQVINFCNKIGCKLILLPIICSENLQINLIHQDCYYQLPHQFDFLDLGTTKVHPGPKQHRAWADFCLEILQKTS